MITIYYLLHMVVLAAFPQREARKIETLCGNSSGILQCIDAQIRKQFSLPAAQAE